MSDAKIANEKLNAFLRQELGYDNWTIEQKVHRERVKLHLSEDYVAGWCGLTPWDYSCIEAGYGKFNQDELDKINELFYTDFKAKD